MKNKNTTYICLKYKSEYKMCSLKCLVNIQAVFEAYLNI